MPVDLRRESRRILAIPVRTNNCAHRSARAVVPVKLGETDGERRDNENEEQAELGNVDQHTAQGDLKVAVVVASSPKSHLQGPQIRVGLEEVNNASEAEYVGDSEERFRS